MCVHNYDEAQLFILQMAAVIYEFAMSRVVSGELNRKLSDEHQRSFRRRRRQWEIGTLCTEQCDSLFLSSYRRRRQSSLRKASFLEWQ